MRLKACPKCGGKRYRTYQFMGRQSTLTCENCGHREAENKNLPNSFLGTIGR